MGDGQGCHPLLLNCATDCFRQWEIMVFTCAHQCTHQTPVDTPFWWSHRWVSKLKGSQNHLKIHESQKGTGRDREGRNGCKRESRNQNTWYMTIREPNNKLSQTGEKEEERWWCKMASFFLSAVCNGVKRQMIVPDWQWSRSSGFRHSWYLCY